jgi:hypothetical protein
MEFRLLKKDGSQRTSLKCGGTTQGILLGEILASFHDGKEREQFWETVALWNVAGQDG